MNRHGTPVFDEVEVSLTAASKTGRYLAEAEIRRRLNNLKGALFHDERRDSYLLRTQAPNGGKVVLIFRVPQSGYAKVVTQTGNHYDWGEYEHIQNGRTVF